MEHFDWLNGFVFPYINFFIYLAILFFFARPALSKMMSAKRDLFLKHAQEAQKAKLQAEEQADILQKKMAGLDKEIATILANAKASAEAEAEAIIKSAEQLAEHLRAEAKRIAQAEVAAARQELQKEIIDEVTAAVANRMLTDVSSEQHQQLILNNISTLKTVNLRSLS